MRTRKWYKLDTAGLIFPAIKRNNWINVYRISATLKDEIDPEILQVAVDNLKDRFPSFYASLHPGFFWNYLEQIKGQVKVRADYAYPLTHMTTREIRKCCIRVFYHEKRIAVEFFHSITDGTGGSIYVRTLVGEYIRLRYDEKIEYTDFVLNPNEKPVAEELEDSFFKYTNGHGNSRKEPTAYKLKGTLEFRNGFLTLTTGIVDTDTLKAVAKKYNCTVTAFLSAVMIQSILPMQLEKRPYKKQKPIVISVAANLRKIFGSKTLRNFVLAENIGIDPLQGDYTLEELCTLMTHQMGIHFNRQHMASAIAANVLPQQNKLVRVMPLPIKQFVMDLVYANHGEKHACINISNLGKLELPENVENYLERMEFIIGVQRSYPNNCSIATVGKTTCINMIRSIKESEIERRFFSTLVELGIPVEIESNRR